MSLDVSLLGEERICESCKNCWECNDSGKVKEELFSLNITHNLNTMAGEAGIYKALWRPEEIKVSKASELIPLLETGLDKLKKDPDKFKKFNPKNGWGDYVGLVNFVEGYLNACKENPEATLGISR